MESGDRTPSHWSSTETRTDGSGDHCAIYHEEYYRRRIYSTLTPNHSISLGTHFETNSWILQSNVLSKQTHKLKLAGGGFAKGVGGLPSERMQSLSVRIIKSLRRHRANHARAFLVLIFKWKGRLLH